MATWTTIPDSLIEPDKPIRSLEALALRDNPVAIAEGAAGAPKIDPLAAFAHNGAAGAVGTYALLVLGESSGSPSQADVTPGETRPGSSLRYANAGGTDGSGSFGGSFSNGGLFADVGAAPSGTWRCMGFARDYDTSAQKKYTSTLWLRIA